MAEYITGKAVLAQSDENGEWFTLHNQLFLDNNSKLYYVPRYFMTDGYTIPKALAFIGGSKMEWDIRPAILHDFECRYHKVLRVQGVSINDLRERGYLREIDKNGVKITVCENLPVEYLVLEDTTFNRANCRFKRGLQALGSVKPWRVDMMRFAVNFNVSWIWSKKEFDFSKIYRGLV